MRGFTVLAGTPASSSVGVRLHRRRMAVTGRLFMPVRGTVPVGRFLSHKSSRLAKDCALCMRGWIAVLWA